MPTPDADLPDAPATIPGPASPTVLAPLPIDTATELPSGEDEPGFPWGWLIAIAALAGAIAAFLFWRRRQTSAPPAVIQLPEPVKPVSGEAAIVVPEAPAAPTTEWLKIDARATELRRSMMNLALTYTLTIANRSGAVLENITVQGDLATAHNRLPVGEQIASPETPLTVRESVTRLAPGERLELEVEILVPLGDVKTIRQGDALLYVPLLRVRVTHDSDQREPLARTWVIGRAVPDGPGRKQGKLNPFRFDAAPQTYFDIGQRPIG